MYKCTINFNVGLYLYLSLCRYCICIYTYIYLSIYPSIHPFIYLSVCLSFCLSVCLSIYLSIDLSILISEAGTKSIHERSPIPLFLSHSWMTNGCQELMSVHLPTPLLNQRLGACEVRYKLNRRSQVVEVVDLS